MILKYGSYSHADNEVWFKIRKQVIHGKTGRRERIRERWDIKGVLQATSVANLTSAMGTLETAYGTDFQDVGFYLSNGSTLTHHAIDSSATITGVKVKSFNWLDGNQGVWGSGTEYVNKRSYHIVVEADTLDNGSEIVFFEESLKFIGNGASKWIMQPSLNGIPIAQIVQTYTTYRAVQSGFSVGLTGYLTLPNNIFSTVLEHGDRRIDEEIGPDLAKNQNTGFKRRWAIFYESNTPLGASPTIPSP